MDNNNISIKTIKDLLKSNFVIPSYQRGYRWTQQEVADLLNDINEFSPKQIPNSNEKTWYCLQPIVVKKINEKQWDVIDGQQRLTTIYLILYYLNQRNKEKSELFDLQYETRKDSTEYLKKGLGDKDINDKKIDYFHFSIAYQTVKKWFEDKNVEESFEPKFYDFTKVIWYEASTKESIDIFTRINSGKIPLTNAELIKALFLRKTNFGKPDMEKEDERIRLKQLEIASEWDRIEYTLQDDSFWYFINKIENKLATRIEFIFNVMYEVAQAEDKDVKERKKLEITTKEQIDARKKENLTILERFGNDEYSTFRFFNEKFKTKSEKEINDNWREIKKYFQTIEEWYNDRELYHKIGYLIAIGTNIKKIIKEKNEKSKINFSNWIKQEIQSKFKKINLEEVGYNGSYVREILLLHNIQTMLNNQNETSRFPFDRYKKDSWDVEHIHAIATEVKVKKEYQVDWLKNNFIKTDNHQNEKLNNEIENIKSGNTIEEKDFEGIIYYVLGEEDNSLQNLCLLDSGTNRSYKNDSFKEKRKKIINREIEGIFVPICTKNVFMKFYSDNVKDIEIWNENDRTEYFEKIKEVIEMYKK